METKTYTGGCHCGKVRFEVETDLGTILCCNCSHCQIKGLLLNFVPATQFTLLAGEESLTEYLFNKNLIHHRFCNICGVEPFATGEKDGVAMVGLNVRSLDNIDLDTLKLTPFDGKSW